VLHPSYHFLNLPQSLRNLKPLLFQFNVPTREGIQASAVLRRSRQLRGIEVKADKHSPKLYLIHRFRVPPQALRDLKVLLSQFCEPF
jgi:hypothetical protein